MQYIPTCITSQCGPINPCFHTLSCVKFEEVASIACLFFINHSHHFSIISYFLRIYIFTCTCNGSHCLTTVSFNRFGWCSFGAELGSSTSICFTLRKTLRTKFVIFEFLFIMSWQIKCDRVVILKSNPVSDRQKLSGLSRRCDTEKMLMWQPQPTLKECVEVTPKVKTESHSLVVHGCHMCNFVKL